jgi:hypothetical protein
MRHAFCKLPEADEEDEAAEAGEEDEAAEADEEGKAVEGGAGPWRKVSHSMKRTRREVDSDDLIPEARGGLWRKVYGTVNLQQGLGFQLPFIAAGYHSLGHVRPLLWAVIG